MSLEVFAENKNDVYLQRIKRSFIPITISLHDNLQYTKKQRIVRESTLKRGREFLDLVIQ